MDRTAALALVCYLAATLLLMPWRTAAQGTLFVSFGVLGGLCIVLVGQRQNPRLLNYGMYLYGYSPHWNEHGEILSFEEGASCHVLVNRDGRGHSALIVNGKVDASTSGDMGMQLAMAYFPHFLHPRARDVVLVGFGSGTTAGASLLFPQTELTCVELEPAVLRVSPLFAHVNHEPHRSPRFHPIVDDGRSFLQGTERTFDLILSQPTNPWLDGVANLFTREFYRSARERLNPGGLFAQWFQAYSLAPDDFITILRTVFREFPHAVLLRVSRADWLIIASPEGLTVDDELFQRTQHLVDSVPEIGADLHEYFGTHSARALFLAHCLFDEAGIARLVGDEPGAPVVTDYNLSLGFDAPLQLHREEDTTALVDRRILGLYDPAWTIACHGNLGASAADARYLDRLAAVLMREGLRGQALPLLDLRARANPDNTELQSEYLTLALEEDPERHAEIVPALLDASLQQACRAGVSLWQSGRFEEAARLFEQVSEREPSSAIVLTNLALCYAGSGEYERAEATIERAKGLEPFSEFVEDNRRRILDRTAGPPAPAGDPEGAEAARSAAPPDAGDPGPSDP